MFSGVQNTTGIEQKCLWVVGVYGISPVGKDNAWKSVVVLETHTVEDANFSYGIQKKREVSPMPGYLSW